MATVPGVKYSSHSIYTTLLLHNTYIYFVHHTHYSKKLFKTYHQQSLYFISLHSATLKILIKERYPLPLFQTSVNKIYTLRNTVRSVRHHCNCVPLGSWSSTWYQETFGRLYFSKAKQLHAKKTDIKESDKNDSFQSYTWREPYSSWAFTNELMNMNNLQISKIFICF